MKQRRAAVAAAILMVLIMPWSVPAAAQETPTDYRDALSRSDNDMNALAAEVENFRINSRYCKPPQIPTKAEAQGELDGLAARAQALNARYNDLKQKLKEFARNPRVAAEMMLRDVDPTADRWWRLHEIARRRMNDALARKRAALAAAPELDCAPKPKPQPVVAAPTFQAPALPIRPLADASATPNFPERFCSRDEYWAFVHQLNQLTERAAESAERAAKYRGNVERAINAYVQNDRPVPRELFERRRQASADFQAANQRLAQADAAVRRAKAITVVDCREPPKQEQPLIEPPRTQPPAPDAPGPKFQTGSLLDQIRNRAWTQIEAMKAANDRCDAEAYRRGLRALERLLEEAKLIRAAATGGGEFSNVTATEADGLVDAIRSIVEGRRRLLFDLEQKCRERTRAQPPATAPTQTGFIPPPDRRMAIILNAHNKARAEAGSPPLRWDPHLAAQAATYRPDMGENRRPVHSSRVGRETSRENLMPALPGTSPEKMVGTWVAEKRNFVPGIFPNVSRTGNWLDVGHYTQMIWPTTTNIGCAITTGGQFDWLVCRYSPPGNRDGRSILADNSGIAPPNSSTPALLDLGKLSDGGMTQIDPPPPPPPPLPTASDDAPGGNEGHHPLVNYGAEAFLRHSAAMDCGNESAARAEFSKLAYALEELRKRLRAAKAAGRFSAVKPEDVQRQINLLESFLRAAEQHRPRGTCPFPPPPPPRLPPPPPRH